MEIWCLLLACVAEMQIGSHLSLWSLMVARRWQEMRRWSISSKRWPAGWLAGGLAHSLVCVRADASAE